jgi:hypothetical protein
LPLPLRSRVRVIRDLNRRLKDLKLARRLLNCL